MIAQKPRLDCLAEVLAYNGTQSQLLVFRICRVSGVRSDGNSRPVIASIQYTRLSICIHQPLFPRRLPASVRRGRITRGLQQSVSWQIEACSV
jgi:hypothetical protein